MQGIAMSTSMYLTGALLVLAITNYKYEGCEHQGWTLCYDKQNTVVAGAATKPNFYM